MRRALLALGLAMAAVPSVIPAAGSLAAIAQHTPHQNNQPPHYSDQSSAPPGGWAMVKPIIPVTTTMVIPHNSVTGLDVVRLALRYLGYPYTLVGNRPELGFSCIGF